MSGGKMSHRSGESRGRAACSASPIFFSIVSSASADPDARSSRRSPRIPRARTACRHVRRTRPEAGGEQESFPVVHDQDPFGDFHSVFNRRAGGHTPRLFWHSSARSGSVKNYCNSTDAPLHTSYGAGELMLRAHTWMLYVPGAPTGVVHLQVPLLR